MPAGDLLCAEEVYRTMKCQRGPVLFLDFFSVGNDREE